MIIIIIEHL